MTSINRSETESFTSLFPKIGVPLSLSFCCRDTLSLLLSRGRRTALRSSDLGSGSATNDINVCCWDGVLISDPASQDPNSAIWLSAALKKRILQNGRKIEVERRVLRVVPGVCDSGAGGGCCRLHR